MGTYPLVLSVWIQPTIHSFNNIPPKKRSCKKNKIKHKGFQNRELEKSGCSDNSKAFQVLGLRLAFSQDDPSKDPPGVSSQFHYHV